MKFKKVKKGHFLALAIIVMTACNPVKEEVETPSRADTEKELAAIENLRANFSQAILEKRYSDLKAYATEDMIKVGPGNEGWTAFREQRAQKLGQFGYDSISMFPKETVILSDSIAYDFGTSVVYYTDENGNHKTLKNTFLLLLKKTDDGHWKLFREVSSAQIKE